MRKIFLIIKVIILFLFIIFPSYLQGQVDVAGKVSDSEGNPIMGVFILSEKNKIAVYSDINGEYTGPLL